MVSRFRALAAAIVLAALTAIAPTAAAQPPSPVPAPAPPVVPDPADPFFDDAVLHDIYITINTRDWASLKEHFLDNTYYPCDFKWNNIAVRNIGVRSRGTGSRSGTKPGLRVDF